MGSWKGCHKGLKCNAALDPFRFKHGDLGLRVLGFWNEFRPKSHKSGGNMGQLTMLGLLV